ncbi:MAG: hypothetical protein IPJ71_10215 [Bdellovibrionales bacterium]|nr:hypothetical protein [Bdellovibrionales bacterium]
MKRFNHICLIICCLAFLAPWSSCSSFTPKIVLKSNNSAGPSSSGPSSTEIEKISIELRAMDIIQARCAGCHGVDSQGFGGIRNIASTSILRERNLIVPGDSENSPLVRMLKSGYMPKGQIMPVEEQQVIADWIQAGANDVSPDLQPTETRSSAEVLSLIQQDISEIKGRQVDLASQRYVNFSYLNQDKITLSEIRQLRLALSKILNSLSWADQIYTPTSISESNLIFRIDLSKLQWTQVTWGAIAAAYPYARTPSSSAETLQTKEIALELGTSVPIVRGDWLLKALSEPELYYKILQIPSEIADLEFALGVDVTKNLNERNVARVGIKNSFVSANNRLIERHPTRFGAYWKSYDFATTSGRASIFNFPVGPIALNMNFFEPETFIQDGGEIIFNLPNGLQAYVIVNEKGHRIDVAPVTVVQDPLRIDRDVVNGISCISCHAQGMNRNVDSVRSSVSANSGLFRPDTFAAVNSMHKLNSEMSEIFDQDDRRFQAALLAIGGEQTIGEPITPVFYRYQSNLSINDVARELGLTTLELNEKSNLDPALKTLIDSIEDNGLVTRRNFELKFGEINDHLQNGTGSAGVSFLRIREIDLSLIQKK